MKQSTSISAHSWNHLADAPNVRAYGVAFEPNPLPAIKPALERLTIPVRLLWGTGDIHFRPEWAEWLHRTLPDSRGVRLVDGAKLFFTEERPDLVAEEATALWA